MHRVQYGVLLCLMCEAPQAHAAPPFLALEDPRGDDRGPGSYVPPSDNVYRAGDFDLRRFSVRVDGKDAVFEVTLGAPVRRDIVRQRTNASELDLQNGIYVQHVDIYIDTTPGAGFTQGLPGRRITFPPQSAWDVAISITPRPGPVRNILRDWNAEAAQKVLTPGPVRTQGPTLTVRVPLWQLGGEPQKSWGWSVTVSGALWQPSFALLDRVRGQAEPDALTMPVFAVPEEHAFGGGKLGGSHPYIIDVILPEGVSQSQVLGRHAAGAPVVLPMVYPFGPPPEPPAPPAAPAPAAASEEAPPREQAQVAQVEAPSEKGRDAGAEPRRFQTLEIASIQGDTAVIPTPEGGVAVWQIGTVVDADGNQVGRVVVTTVSSGFVLATLTDGKERVRVGSQVRFPLPRRTE
jgi:hypothetical protein